MDVSKLCRSCMEEVATWECEDVDQKTMNMFVFCTNIEVSDDDKLPKHFCYHCTVLIESSYIYIKKAKRVNSKLKKLAQISFLDNLLIKTNFVEPEKLEDENVPTVNNLAEAEKDIDALDEKVTANDLDHDIFDEDDEKCLSEFKSENSVNQTNEELFKEQSEISTVIKTEESKTEVLPESKTKTNKHPKHYKNNKCPICKKTFAKKGWFSRHVKLAHTEKADKIKALKRLKDRDRKRIVYEKRRREAEAKNTGDPKDEIKCRVCNEKFASKSWRTKHLNAEHSQKVDGQRVYLCPYCPKTFAKYSHMYYHTTSHPDVVKHPCRTCGKEYRIRKELDTHERTHLIERPYACDKCDMRFKLKGILVTHLKWHDGVRPYLCSKCGRSFLQSGNLESHMRVHTGEKPFACKECSFRSTSRVSLKRHELRHKGERPYPCTYCPKRFYESCSLTRHVRSHTRERPYHCPYCSRYFNDSGKRRRHFLMTHKMAPEEIPPMDKDGATIERTPQNGPRKATAKSVKG